MLKPGLRTHPPPPRGEGIPAPLLDHTHTPFCPFLYRKNGTEKQGAKVLHRDIKPNNLAFTAEFRTLKLFGGCISCLKRVVLRRCGLGLRVYGCARPD